MKEKAANLHKRLQRKVGEALGTFGLIERGDRILIGLSGGKDSLALLDLLGERMTRSGGYFEVEALHVRMRGVDYESDTAYLEQMALNRTVTKSARLVFSVPGTGASSSLNRLNCCIATR